jgi:hypothetical protein
VGRLNSRGERTTAARGAQVVGDNPCMSAGRVALLRILGYVVGLAGTILLVAGLVLVAALLLTFRLR